MSMNDFLSMLSEEQKKALLQALTENSDTPKEVKQEPTKNVSENFVVDNRKQSSNKRREQVRGRKNEWVDTGEFRDIETNYGDRTPRNRKPHKKIDVECSVCGRSFKEDPKYIYGEYHRCNKCVKR